MLLWGGQGGVFVVGENVVDVRVVELGGCGVLNDGEEGWGVGYVGGVGW